jgi:hypothetical protein
MLKVVLLEFVHSPNFCIKVATFSCGGSPANSYSLGP